MKFSIIIPAYNAEKFVERSINSVLNQTFTDFEVIIVNDGSKDKTSERARSIIDKRIVVIDKVNEGVSVARNTGIQNARGEYICFLDADDEYLTEHLSHLDYLIGEYPDKNFFSTRYCMSRIDDAGYVDVPATTGTTEYYENFVHENNVRNRKLCTDCMCIKREIFQKYGMFEPGVKIGEDTDMWRRIYVHTGIVYSDNITVKCNRDGSEATRHYTRNFEADPLNRIPRFLADDTIPENVKESLKTEYELSKLSVVRSCLYVGDKKRAKKLLKEIDKTRITKNKLYITYICFCVPSLFIRAVFKVKNRGIYG